MGHIWDFTQAEFTDLQNGLFFFIALDISSKTGIDLCDLLAYRERAKWGDSAEMNVFPDKFIKDKATLQTS